MDGVAAYINKDICNEKHKRVDDELKRQDETLDDHGKRIVTLEKSDASHTTQLDSLVNALDRQTKAIWGFAGSTILVLLGFVIWYIQSK